ncbi:MAG TPA: hypothetical protein VLF18_14335, partial [Tahibacter sp.]|uniref:hypothetical protein n=1 Tax=Tahibacter sp. TaxID=2056211 RepID=UPI002C464A13
MKTGVTRRVWLPALLMASVSATALADNSALTLPVSQDWNNNGLITAANDWSGVPGFIGYRGDGLAAGTGADAQTIVADGTGTPVNVNANQTTPNSFTTGGVTEFQLTNSTVALAGSGTAKAPFLLLNLNTTGRETIHVAYTVRDLETGADNAAQQVALQYRVGNSGDFTNIASAYIADATTTGTPAGPDITRDITLPAAANNQSLV